MDTGLVKRSTMAGKKGWHHPVTYGKVTFIRKQNILLKPFELFTLGPPLLSSYTYLNINTSFTVLSFPAL